MQCFRIGMRWRLLPANIEGCTVAAFVAGNIFLRSKSVLIVTIEAIVFAFEGRSRGMIGLGRVG